MKKILVTSAVILAFCLAGSAFAGSGRYRGGYCWGYDDHPRYMDGLWEERMNASGDWRPYHDFNIPQEISDKREEARKIELDLRDELGKRPVDKARALELYRKHRQLLGEIGEWFFIQRMEQFSQDGK